MGFTRMASPSSYSHRAYLLRGAAGQTRAAAVADRDSTHNGADAAELLVEPFVAKVDVPRLLQSGIQ